MEVTSSFVADTFCILFSYPYCLLSSRRQSLLQNLFLRFFDGHAVTLAVLIDRAIVKRVTPEVAHFIDFPERILWHFRLARANRQPFLLAGLRRRGLAWSFSKSRRALQSRLRR